MSMALSLIQRGSFTSDGSAQKLSMPGGVDYMEVVNLTQAATTQATGRGVIFKWFPSQAAGGGLMLTKQNASNALDLESLSSGGFTYVQSYPEPGAAVGPGSSITAANPPVVTINNHGFSDGDRVVLYNTTGMLQIGGMDFVVASATTNTFELEGQDFSGFLAAATAVTARLLPSFDLVTPAAVFVTSVSQAAQAVVVTSTAHNYVANQVVKFSIPSGYGMTALDQQEAKIVSVTDAYTFVVDLNTAAYNAFAIPASGSSPVKLAMVASEGQRNSYDFTNVPYQSGQFIPYMLLAAGADSPAGSSNDVIQWLAYKAENGS